MTKDRHVWLGSEMGELERAQNRKARETYGRVVGLAIDRTEKRGLSVPEVMPTHWLYPVVDLFYGQNKDVRPRLYDLVDANGIAHDLSQVRNGKLAVLQRRHTHYLRQEYYPPRKEGVKRSRTKWFGGSWFLNEQMDNLIWNDELLSSDFMHIWMWCCIPNGKTNFHCQSYLKRFFTILLHQEPYQSKYNGMSASQLMSCVYTFHLGGCIKWHSSSSQAQRRHELGREIGIVA
jgi:hypothetical protein